MNLVDILADNIRSGAQNTATETLRQICKALHCGLGELFRN
jgi:DNA-binding Xre family transcriptional regulator